MSSELGCNSGISARGDKQFNSFGLKGALASAAAAIDASAPFTGLLRRETKFCLENLSAPTFNNTCVRCRARENDDKPSWFRKGWCRELVEGDRLNQPLNGAANAAAEHMVEGSHGDMFFILMCLAVGGRLTRHHAHLRLRSLAVNEPNGQSTMWGGISPLIWINEAGELHDYRCRRRTVVGDVVLAATGPESLWELP